jgi:putative peptidoglycan lipid II flippase
MSMPGAPQAGPAGADRGSSGRHRRPKRRLLPLRRLEPEPADADHPRPAADPGQDRGTSIVRSSGVMAAGTLASRVTGLLRTLAQAYALGAVALADAYNVANSLPNAVYNLMLGGILTSVIVPLLVNAATRDADRGEAYDQRMFTLLTLTLLAITLTATLAAAPLVHLYSGPVTGPELHLMVIFAYFFIPQIFFYGVSSLAGAVLNSRGSFAAPMWTPVINNIVVIGVLLGFIYVAGFGVRPATITGPEVQLLGLGTTLGVAAQTAALIPALRRAGFRWRPRFDFRRAELAEIRRMATWMFGYIATTQVTLLVTTRVANDASVLAARAHVGYGAGYTPFAYAWQLFQMPYAIVGISVITALLPRMSAHAAARRPDHVRADFSAGLRLSSVIVVPSALVLAVLGPDLAEVFLAHGATSVASARYMGEVFAVLCLGLVPYTVFQLQLRVFYALHDSRTPALIGVLTMIVNVGANYAALTALPPGQVVAGLGFAFGLGNLAGSVLAWRLLSRRLGGMDGRVIGACLLRTHAAAVPAALLALAVALAAATVLPPGPLGALVAVTLAGAAALLLYLFLARVFRVSELTGLLATVTARLHR